MVLKAIVLRLGEAPLSETVAEAPAVRAVLSKVAVSTAAKAASRPAEPWLAPQLAPKPLAKVPHEPLPLVFQTDWPE